MVSKSSILFAIIISTALLLVSAKYYAGDSLYDKNAIEYSWRNNFLVNPFVETTVDDPENASEGTHLKYIVPFCRFSFIGY
jgi:hypothetical protein